MHEGIEWSTYQKTPERRRELSEVLIGMSGVLQFTYKAWLDSKADSDNIDDLTPEQVRNVRELEPDEWVLTTPLLRALAG